MDKTNLVRAAASENMAEPSPTQMEKSKRYKLLTVVSHYIFGISVMLWLAMLILLALSQPVWLVAAIIGGISTPIFGLFYKILES